LLDEAHARIFAAEQGYDLVDDDGMLTDWWGYCWMILAEKRGLLTPENRAAARAAIEKNGLTAPNVISVIVGRWSLLNPRPLRASMTRPSMPQPQAARRRGSPQATAFHPRPFPRLPGATFISPSRARTSAVNR
jgi:hypothetical protein